jgi:hypothetical protein
MHGTQLSPFGQAKRAAWRCAASVLGNIEGPHANVLKIQPSMVFDD